MKKTSNITKIRNFFQTIYYEENATKEEVFNFLQECLKFVFDEVNINYDEQDITFHILQELPNKNTEAMMTANEKYDNKFDVMFQKDALTIKDALDLDGFLYYLCVCFHEFGHIVQYIKHPDYMLIFDEEYIAYTTTLEELKSTTHKCHELKNAIKAFSKFLDAQDFISYIEKDATKQAYTYYKSMLNQLMKQEKDEELLTFFTSIYKNLQLNKKDEYIEYRKQSKRSREALEVLEKYNFEFNTVISLD